MRKVLIVKASGEVEAFDPSKVHHALMRAGAGEDIADKIVKNIASRVRPGMTTKKIFAMTFKLLNKERPALASRFDLKQAMFRLGPAGYAFEQYTSALFTIMGYECQTGQILHGRCVKHEVDVVAMKPGERAMVECKFHNRPGVRCHVQTGLYTFARFLDLTEGKEKFTEPWLVTNTKFTGDLIDYSQCRGLKLLGWNYPVKGSLEELIDRQKLYPVTILQSLDSLSRERLLKANIVTIKQLRGLSEAKLKSCAKMSARKAKELKQEASRL
ncbi:MAG: restriction endonuclease [Candidatus Diapherotrites archaeon]|nr:restriction endonuclease [Candidatus Diapherotrites archaeon]